MVVLLDLNYTLVANSGVRVTPFCQQVVGETYRLDLLKMVKAHLVILITARPAKYRELTLYSLRAKTGWAPQKSFFNDLGLPPAPLKRSKLVGSIMPVHGRDPRQYVAIESNPECRAMYASYGIVAHQYGDPDLQETLQGEV